MKIYFPNLDFQEIAGFKNNYIGSDLGDNFFMGYLIYAFSLLENAFMAKEKQRI